jgi:Domain of unknown function (DUF5602)
MTLSTYRSRVSSRVLSLMLLSALSGMTGCGDEPSGNGDGEVRSTGPSQTFGNGTAQAFVTLNAAAIPTALGVVLSESVLTSLPASLTEAILALPDQGAATPFNFVRVTFMPQGHPPPGIYDKAHFDLHFFLITEQEVSAVGPSDPDFQQKGAQAPPPGHTPPDYVPDPMRFRGTVPIGATRRHPSSTGSPSRQRLFTVSTRAA